MENPFTKEHEITRYLLNLFLTKTFFEAREEISELFKHEIPNDSFIKFPFYFNSGEVIIGNNTKIFENCTLNASYIEAGGGIFIGNNVLIANNTKLITNAHKHDLTRKWYSEKIIIKDNVWIGADATILPGVTIGENSIIGAGSVVTKNVGDNEIWAGNPARFIKTIYEN